MAEFIKSTILVITQKSARLRESGLLDECAPHIQSSRSGWQPGVLSSWARALDLLRTSGESPEQ